MKTFGKIVICLLAMLMIGVCLFAGGTSDNRSQEKKLVFGMNANDATMPYVRAAHFAVLKKAEELGIEIRYVGTQWDNQRLLDSVDNFITLGIDGYINAGLANTREAIPAFKKLNEAGIPIAAIDASPDGGYLDFYISFDKTETTAKAANVAIQKIKQQHGGEVPKGVVIEVMGDTTSEFSFSCSEGIKSVVSQYPQLRLVQGSGEWNNDDTYKVVSDFFTRFGDDVLAVMVHTPDIMGIGAVNAIKTAGRNPNDYALTGICIGPEGLDLLNKNEFTTIVEQPIMDAAEMAVELVYNKIKGLPVPEIGDTIEKEGELWSPAVVIKNPYTPDGGAWIKLSAPLVPQEVDVDDPRLWENIMKEQE